MGRRSRSRSRSPKRDRRRSPPRDRDRDRRERHTRSPHRRRRTPSPRRRSPVGRRRSRSRERERERPRDVDRRDREPVAMEYNHGQPTREIVNTSYPIPKPQPPPARGLSNRPAIQASEMEGKSEEEIEMMKLMGFGGFETTKGKHVAGNDVYVASIQRKRRYRQYMNRRGGFNRPLDFIA